jgi:cytochrome b561
LTEVNWNNSTQEYGVVSKALHWLSAIITLSLFGLGLWMVELSYYSAYYQTAPYWHKSVGILLFTVTVIRLVWLQINSPVEPLNPKAILRNKIAKLAHKLIYILLFCIMLSGYLISTADGRSIEVFYWLDIPSLGQLFSDQADVSGDIHKYLAYGLILVIALHVLAALKHHLINKDNTLKRIL